MNLPEALPSDGTAISAVDLATASKSPDSTLIMRSMRTLVALNFAVEPHPGYYSHGALTRLLCLPMMKGFVRYLQNCYNPGLVYLDKTLKATGYKTYELGVNEMSFDKLSPMAQEVLVDYPEREADYTIAMGVAAGIDWR